MSFTREIALILVYILLFSTTPTVLASDVTLGSGIDTTVENVTVLKINDFYSNVTAGTYPLKTNFVSNVTGNVTEWNWTFEPIDPKDYYSKHPVTALHTFKQVGLYTVALTVKDASGNVDTMKKVNYINVTAKQCTDTKKTETVKPSDVCAKPTLVFTSDRINAKVGQKVIFQAKVTGSPTKWVWNFGDGITSSSGNGAGHTYKKAGTYTVVVKVTNSAGTTTVTSKDLIKVC